MTNAEPDERVLLSKFGKKGNFLFSPFSMFDNNDAIRFFEKLGVKNFEVRVNDRRLLDDFFESEKISADKKISILRIIDKLDKIGAEKVEEEIKEIGVDKKIALLANEGVNVKNGKIVDFEKKFFRL